MTDKATDPREALVYEATEIGRWVGCRPSLVRRWLRSTLSGQRGSPASFLNLIDLLFAQPFLSCGLRFKHLRAALDEAGCLLGIDHFALRDFFTAGHGIFLRPHTYGNSILRLLSDGQWIPSDEIVTISNSIDFDEVTGLAERGYPHGRNGLIVIDPFTVGGRPSIDSRCVSTANIYSIFIGQRRSMNRTCALLGLDTDEVEAAVVFEEHGR